MRDRRTDVVFARVTAEEKARIRQYAAGKGGDISQLTRELWIRELAGMERHACSRLFELFRRTMRATLEMRDGFTVERFERICQDLDITRQPTE